MSDRRPPDKGDPPKPGPYPPGRGETQAANPFDRLRQCLQYLLDCEGDGWQLAHYVVVIGMQKIGADGQISNAAWMASPLDQPDYVTDGLISSAEDMRASCDVEDD